MSMTKHPFQRSIRHRDHAAALVRLTHARGTLPVGSVVHRVSSGLLGEFSFLVSPGIYSYVNGVPPKGDQFFFRMHEDGTIEALTRQQVFAAFAPSAA
jgi:hypothetical protein